MKRRIRVMVAEPSSVVRSGILTVLRQIDSVHVELTEVSGIDKLKNSVGWHKPDILIINPSLAWSFPLHQLKKESANPEIKCVALQMALFDPHSLKCYDEIISIYDSTEQICEKIVKLIDQPVSDRRRDPLSEREKEVIVCVIQGMTNKQIADKLCLSTHTVTTHRRNISAKLDIHSTAGLTIYAIVNKLIELSDIKDPEA